MENFRFFQFFKRKVSSFNTHSALTPLLCSIQCLLIWQCCVWFGIGSFVFLKSFKGKVSSFNTQSALNPLLRSIQCLLIWQCCVWFGIESFVFLKSFKGKVSSFNTQLNLNSTSDFWMLGTSLFSVNFGREHCIAHFLIMIISKNAYNSRSFEVFHITMMYIWRSKASFKLSKLKNKY